MNVQFYEEYKEILDLSLEGDDLFLIYKDLKLDITINDYFIFVTHDEKFKSFEECYDIIIEYLNMVNNYVDNCIVPYKLSSTHYGLYGYSHILLNCEKFQLTMEINLITYFNYITEEYVVDNFNLHKDYLEYFKC